MTYVRDGVHYMYGIYSTKTVMDASRDVAMLLFTDVLYDGHLSWLMRQWRDLQVQHGNYTVTTVPVAVAIATTVQRERTVRDRERLKSPTVVETLLPTKDFLSKLKSDEQVSVRR